MEHSGVNDRNVCEFQLFLPFCGKRDNQIFEKYAYFPDFKHFLWKI